MQICGLRHVCRFLSRTKQEICWNYRLQGEQGAKILMFESGVKFYTWKTATINIVFPENQIACHWCRYCRKDEIGRFRCRLTDNILYHAPLTGIDLNCPINNKEGEQNG